MNVSGKRINANTAQLSGQTAGRANKITATVQSDHSEISFQAAGWGRLVRRYIDARIGRMKMRATAGYDTAIECRYNGFEILSMNRLDRKSRWISAGIGYLQWKNTGNPRKPPNDWVE